MTGVESSKALPESVENRSSRFAAARGAIGRLQPLWTGVLAVALLGAVLMVVSEFVTLRSVKVLTASCSDLADPSLRGSCVTHGGEEHSYALVLLGVVTVLMAWGAVMGRSRPAGAAMALLGAAVLVIALVTDVPDIHKTGVLGERFDSAHAEAGPGLWMEIVAGALVFAAGVVAAAVRRPKARSRR
jgi:hypothetical protein